MKWQDLYYRWVFSIPSKLLCNESLDSVWSWMPWSYWVINSSLRHCGFVRCLQEKGINILETVTDKSGNQNGSWKPVERRLMRPNTETTKMMRAQQRQSFKTCRVTTDGTWGSGIFDAKSLKWGLFIPAMHNSMVTRGDQWERAAGRQWTAVCVLASCHGASFGNWIRSSLQSSQ